MEDLEFFKQLRDSLKGLTETLDEIIEISERNNKEDKEKLESLIGTFTYKLLKLKMMQ